LASTVILNEATLNVTDGIDEKSVSVSPWCFSPNSKPASLVVIRTLGGLTKLGEDGSHTGRTDARTEIAARPSGLHTSRELNHNWHIQIKFTVSIAGVTHNLLADGVLRVGVSILTKILHNEDRITDTKFGFLKSLG
jgi:hypothetical protein